MKNIQTHKDTKLVQGNAETSCGTLPKGWKKFTIDDLFDIKNGYTPSKAITSYWNNGTIPWFRLEDIRKNGRILKDSIQHITPEAVKGGKLFPAGSFIISTTATIGEHALLIADSLANQQFSFLVKKLNREKYINDIFFLYYLYIIGDWCRNNINEGGLLAVNVEDLKKYEVSLPPLAEQRRIAAILSDMDAHLAALDALIAKKQAIKKGTMQQLLTGKKRLAGFDGEWKECRLGEYVNIRTGKLDANAANEKGIYPFFTCAKAISHIDYYAFDCECVLVAGNGDLNVKYYNGKFNAYQRTYIIESKEKNVLSINFLYWFLYRYIEILRTESVGGTIKFIKLPFLKEALLPLPSLSEQRAISAILSDMDKEISALQAKRAKYEALKHGAMQRLINVECRM